MDDSGEAIRLSKKALETERRRERKWLEMLNRWDDWMLQNPKKIKSRCRKGIPASVRGRDERRAQGRGGGVFVAGSAPSPRPPIPADEASWWQGQSRGGGGGQEPGWSPSRRSQGHVMLNISEVEPTTISIPGIV